MLERFYLIVDDVAWLTRFLPLGLRLVQLRIKDKPIGELRPQIAAAQRICRQAHCQLIVNDYWRLALELGCDFVHLGQEDLADADLGAIRAGGLRLGISTHSDSELDRALAAAPDYVALGPIYPTILKSMAWAPQGLARIRAWKARVGTLPLVAIGGLNPTRAAAVFKAGADSVCVVTDVLRAQSPESRLTQWLRLANRPVEKSHVL